MASYQQDLILTVLPVGIEKLTVEPGVVHTYLDFSLLFSPRLGSDQTTAQLANYPDWSSAEHTWPDTLDTVLPSMRLRLPNLAGAPSLPVSIVGTHPDPARFAAALPGTTPVTPYVFKGADKHKIRSAPVGQIADAVQSVYGRFGFDSPTSFPAYHDLVGVDAFGPMGFQQDNPPRTVGSNEIPGSGPKRKTDLNQKLEQTLTAAKAIPYDLTSIARATGIAGAKTSMAFLQLQRFLQRNLPLVNQLSGRPDPPEFDFHQRVGALQSLPTLLRLLGLALDLRAGPVDQALVDDWEANGADTFAFVTVNKSLFLGTTNIVNPKTKAHLEKGVFKAAPKNPATAEHLLRMLKIGDPNLYRVVRVDHDGAGIKAIQFGNNLTRSRNKTGKLSSVSPDNYALPALHTGGFAVARSGRATQMVGALARQTALQNGLFASPPSPTPPPLFEEDLIRGYRFDVLDVADKVWRSLMWRQGTIVINGTDPLPVLEEDTVVPAPTTAQPTQSPTADLYLQETLTKWDGWSLAVPRVGTPWAGTQPTSPDSGSTGFNVTTDWHVPGSSTSGDPETATGNERRLPRLRFGRTYKLRARATDLAGNALPVRLAPKTSDLLITPPMQHLRFEPFTAPRAFLPASGTWQPLPDAPQALRPGDSEEVVVIRSESATVNAKTELDNGVSIRLLIPPQSSVTLAEQHNAFDDAIAGKPMEQAVEVWTDIANRDGTDIHAKATRLFPEAAPSTANPWLFPDFLPVDYLPEVPVEDALVRHLPINAFKQTTATLPFDTAGNGWPKLQAVRLRLARGASNDWSVSQKVDPANADNVTSELDLTLAKGVMVTTLVNCGISDQTLSLMALWDWIVRHAAKVNKSTTSVHDHIVAGEHWMFTPWRQVTFVHAVRTPLKDPVLELKPTKSSIGQTFATFHGTQAAPSDGTILFSRRSTARVDVDARWFMPVDTGTNADPVTPQEFTAHAFSIEPTRTGKGWIKDANDNSIQVADAQNLNAKHEFHDTKYRAVTYRGTATSFYPEYFREQRDLAFAGDPVAALKAAPVTPGVAFEASTVRLTLRWTDNGVVKTRLLNQAPAGTALDAPAPTPGDYLVVEDPTLNGPNPDGATNGTIQLLENAAVDTGLTNLAVEFSYVGPTIHTFSKPASDKTVNMHVLNSARPKAPDVLYVIPIYKRTVTRTGINRTGGGLRVYLNRPWWSSGDGERLGVVCWHRTTNDKLPPDALAPYVTLWGYDPIFQSSTSLPAQPTPSSFPLATASNNAGVLTIEESLTKVDVAGHPVGYDATRGLWYCDIQVTDPKHHTLVTYTPFIRLALARYQPFSIQNAHLSRVVLVDYAQLAPDRHLTITSSGQKRVATITGRAARATSSSSQPNRIRLLIEQRDGRVPDDEMGWVPATGAVGFKNEIVMQATASSATTDFVTWTAEITLPNTSVAYRLTFEEYERISGGFSGGRLAWTESYQVQSPPQ